MELPLPASPDRQNCITAPTARVRSLAVRALTLAGALAAVVAFQSVQSAQAGDEVKQAAPVVAAAGARYTVALPGALVSAQESTPVKAVNTKELPAESVMLGVWQPGAPQDLTKIADLEKSIGTKFAIVHWFQGWGAGNAALDTALLSRVAARGSVPMITWEAWDYTKGVDQPQYRLAAIASGQHDAYARSWARGLAQYPGPVLIRFGHEMNYGRYPWAIGVNGNTAKDYVAAWRRLHDIFRAEGARNVQWVWSPGVAWDAETAFEPMYPGDAYVDWLALDGYNNTRWGKWSTFSQIFGDSYRQMTALSNKPIMIAETGSSEESGNKGQWITDTFREDIPNFPRIKAIVWFNENWPNEGDYRITSSSQATTAFSQAINLPKYQALWQGS